MSLSRITCAVFLVLLVFPVQGGTGPNVVEAFCPVVARGEFAEGESPDVKFTAYLLGGWSGKVWLQDKAAASFVRGGEKYRFYNLTGELSVAVGGVLSPGII